MQKILHSFHKSEPELEVKEPETFQSLPLNVLHCEDRAGIEALAPFLMVPFSTRGVGSTVFEPRG